MNREAERKRLVELIENFFEKEIGASFVKGFLDKFADNILDDGWMRPTVQMGQTVYSYCEEFCRVFEYRVENIHLSEETTQYEAFCCIGMELADVIDFDDDDIGKTVFTSREDALKALEGSGEK